MTYGGGFSNGTVSHVACGKGGKWDSGRYFERVSGREWRVGDTRMNSANFLNKTALTWTMVTQHFLSPHTLLKSPKFQPLQWVLGALKSIKNILVALKKKKKSNEGEKQNLGAMSA